jgi:hypothetical protein
VRKKIHQLFTSVPVIPKKTRASDENVFTEMARSVLGWLEDLKKNLVFGCRRFRLDDLGDYIGESSIGSLFEMSANGVKIVGQLFVLCFCGERI